MNTSLDAVLTDAALERVIWGYPTASPVVVVREARTALVALLAPILAAKDAEIARLSALEAAVLPDIVAQRAQGTHHWPSKDLVALAQAHRDDSIHMDAVDAELQAAEATLRLIREAAEAVVIAWDTSLTDAARAMGALRHALAGT